MGTQLLNDCLATAMFIKSIDNIQLYTLSLQDIIISKLARGDSRDFIDIKAIFEYEKIDMDTFIIRYKNTMDNSVVANSRQKLLDLIDIKFNEWNFSIDIKILNKVRKWQ